jgi:hypothetical protein
MIFTIQTTAKTQADRWSTPNRSVTGTAKAEALSSTPGSEQR